MVMAYPTTSAAIDVVTIFLAPSMERHRVFVPAARADQIERTYCIVRFQFPTRTPGGCRNRRCSTTKTLRWCGA